MQRMCCTRDARRGIPDPCRAASSTSSGRTGSIAARNPCVGLSQNIPGRPPKPRSTPATDLRRCRGMRCNPRIVKRLRMTIGRWSFVRNRRRLCSNRVLCPRHRHPRAPYSCRRSGNTLQRPCIESPRDIARRRWFPKFRWFHSFPSCQSSLSFPWFPSFPSFRWSLSCHSSPSSPWFRSCHWSRLSPPRRRSPSSCLGGPGNSTRLAGSRRYQRTLPRSARRHLGPRSPHMN